MPVYNITGSQKLQNINQIVFEVQKDGVAVDPDAEFINFTGSAVTSVVVNGTGVDVTLTAGTGGGGVQWPESVTSPRIRTTASVAIGAGAVFAQDVGSNVHFYVSGSTTGNPTIVFGGDVQISGSLHIQNIANQSESYIDLQHGSPDAPGNSTTRIYGTMRASRSLLSVVGPAGQDFSVQPSFFGNSISLWTPFGNALTQSFGITFLGTGTLTHTTWSTSITNTAYSGAGGTIKKARFASVNVLGNGGGIRTQDSIVYRSTVTGAGGWFMHARFNIPFNVPSRAFIGLTFNTGGMVGWREDVSGTVNTTNNCNFIGIGWDRLDPLTGSWRLMKKDTTNYTSEEIPNMQRNLTSGSIVDFISFCKPMGTGVNVQVIEHKIVGAATGETIQSFTRLEGFYTSSIPAAAAALRPQIGVFNHTGAHAVVVDINRLYIETDY